MQSDKKQIHDNHDHIDKDCDKLSSASEMTEKSLRSNSSIADTEKKWAAIEKR